MRRAIEAGEEAHANAFLKRFTVFNTAQCVRVASQASKAADLLLSFLSDAGRVDLADDMQKAA